MHTTVSTNQRLVTVLLVLLLTLVSLLVVGTVVVFLMMSGGMMLPGMMGMNGQTMSDMLSGCTDMMKNIPQP